MEEERKRRIIIKAWQDVYGDLYNEKDIAEYEWDFAQAIIKRYENSTKRKGC